MLPNHDEFTMRVKNVTGEEWCPYPSELMVRAVMLSNDTTAKELIIERRKYIFPQFLVGEPMLEKLLSVIGEIENVTHKEPTSK